MKVEDILEIPMKENDAEAVTIGEYLQALLWQLWREGEGFSGKRPFGNSGWEFDIYQALVYEGVVEGSVDEDGYLEDVDTKAANQLVFKIIENLYNLDEEIE